MPVAESNVKRHVPGVLRIAIAAVALIVAAQAVAQPSARRDAQARRIAQNSLATMKTGDCLPLVAAILGEIAADGRGPEARAVVDAAFRRLGFGPRECQIASEFHNYRVGLIGDVLDELAADQAARGVVRIAPR